MCLYNPSLQSLTLVVLEVYKVGKVQGVQRRQEGAREVGKLALPPAELAAQGPVVLL